MTLPGHFDFSSIPQEATKADDPLQFLRPDWQGSVMIQASTI